MELDNAFTTMQGTLYSEELRLEDICWELLPSNIVGTFNPQHRPSLACTRDRGSLTFQSGLASWFSAPRL